MKRQIPFYEICISEFKEAIVEEKVKLETIQFSKGFLSNYQLN